MRGLILSALLLACGCVSAGPAPEGVIRAAAFSEGGMEPGASRVGPPSEGRLKEAIADLLAGERRLRVVVFSAHPDDPMWGAAGLMALLARGGHEVISAYGTCFRGDRKIGDELEAVVRRREAAASCKAVGATPKFFDYAHETFTADAGTVQALSSWLEEVKPDIVVTHWPMDTHPNHHAMSSLVWQGYKPRGGWTLYFYEVGPQTLGFRPELYLDLAEVGSVKREALSCHDGSLGAISGSKPGGPWVKAEERHRLRGAECGVARAEAFVLVEAKEGCPLLPVPFLGRKER